MLRVRGQARIEDTLDLRMRLQPARQVEGGGRLRLHAYLQGLHAFQYDPGIEG
jgi:hypothetical protein